MASTSIAGSPKNPPFAPPSSPLTQFSVDFKDPWTIAAIVLLGLLSSVAIYRIYYTVFRTKGRKNRPGSISVEKVVVDEKKIKSHHSTRAQMRG